MSCPIAQVKIFLILLLVHSKNPKYIDDMLILLEKLTKGEDYHKCVL